jgi:ATP-dependent Zn protease
LLTKHRAVLDKITEELLVKETLEEADFTALVGMAKGIESK